MRPVARREFGRLGAAAVLAGLLIAGAAPATAFDEPAADTSKETPLVYYTLPLPPSESPRFDAAVQRLEPFALGMAAAGMPRYKCWLDKLKTGDVDDRLIEWGLICPSKTGALGNAFAVGPCELRGPRPSQAEIQAAISSVADVEAKGAHVGSTGIFTHLKSAIVFWGELAVQPLDALRAIHDDVNMAIINLDLWANAPMGGSSAMPTAYVSIKDWIGQRQRDPKSLYNCH